LPEIAFRLYEDMTALDAVGPYEVLARLPGADALDLVIEYDPDPTELMIPESAEATR
jgi:hypothetical protein